jgi:hypothetical protein
MFAARVRGVTFSWTINTFLFLCKLVITLKYPVAALPLAVGHNNVALVNGNVIRNKLLGSYKVVKRPVCRVEFRLVTIAYGLHKHVRYFLRDVVFILDVNLGY